MTSCCGFVEDRVGWAGFGDAAGVHDVDRVRDVAGEAHRVRDDDHRLAGLGQVGDHADHFGGHPRVERAGGLVEEDRFGLHRQGAGDGDALLLAAGELVGAGGELVGEADAVQELPGFGFALVAGAAEHVERAGEHVFQHVHVREQVELLEHHADAAAELAERIAELACGPRRGGAGPGRLALRRRRRCRGR